ncbi:MAG: hypothetical protein IKW13_00530 [Thermoguttaceae bacterium]|nr:hypothetical protein [Thermoguttaceae bacterium]
MKCPNCQSVHTLRRAKKGNADWVVCDACDARFKILRNNRAQPNRRREKTRSAQSPQIEVATTNETSKTQLVPVPPPVLDVESSAVATLDKTSPAQKAEEYLEREEEYEKIVPTFGGAALRQAKNFIAYFSQAVSTRYFLGIGLYFLGILSILCAIACTFSAGEAFRTFIRFIGLTFSFLAFTAALSVLARRFSVFDRPLNFTWRFLAIIAPIIIATLALVPAYPASRPSAFPTGETGEANNVETSTRQAEVDETFDDETDTNDVQR